MILQPNIGNSARWRSIITQVFSIKCKLRFYIFFLIPLNKSHQLFQVIVIAHTRIHVFLKDRMILQYLCYRKRIMITQVFPLRQSKSIHPILFYYSLLHFITCTYSPWLLTHISIPFPNTSASTVQPFSSSSTILAVGRRSSTASMEGPV